MDGQIIDNGQIDKQIGKQIDRYTYNYIEGWTLDSQMDIGVYRQDRQIDNQIYEQIDRNILVRIFLVIIFPVENVWK